jgi:D-3-phosphoglycerate dehydrogenase
MRIAVLDDYAGAFQKVTDFPRLKNHEVVVFRDTVKNPAELAVRLRGADVVVLTQERSSFLRPVIEKLPQLKLIAQTGAHRHHLDISACTENGIAIAAMSGGGRARSTVELSWALIFASVRNIPHEVQQLKQGTWQTTVGTELEGKTLGIYGLGRIGNQMAEIGKAFGMKVTCWGRETSKAKAREAGYEVPDSREIFFESADVLTLHIFFDAETKGIITAADLAHMKPTALLVNTSRALLIQEGALVEALNRGRPGFAAVDVYEDEPVVHGNHPLLKVPNAMCTPHLGYAVWERYEAYFRDVIDNILAFASGKPANIINPQALGKR